MKKCTICKMEKCPSYFCKDKSRSDGLSSKCRDCAKTINVARRQKDPTAFKKKQAVHQKKYRERLAGEKLFVYRKKDRERSSAYRQANREKVLASQKEYYQRNIHKYRAYWAKRRASLREATPSWLTKKHIAEIDLIYAQARDCEVVSGEPYHVDHIVPLQGKNICGLHVPWNLQVLPADVNLSKGNSHE